MEVNESVLVRDLSFKYGSHTAIREMTFCLPHGEIIGLVGENGSGKTTLMRILAGMAQQYRGNVSIAGFSDTWAAKQIVCYYPSNAFYDGTKTIAQTIRLYASLFPEYNRELACTLFRQFDFDLSVRLNQLSKGKSALALFILHFSREAILYMFDEPFGGIDIKTRSNMIDIILQYAVPEKTFLISTHEIYDVETLFDRILLIKQGRILLNDEADQLRERFGQSITEIVREAL